MGGLRYQNAYGCLRCKGWVGLKKTKCLRMLTLSRVGGSKKPKCLRMLTLSTVGGSKKSQMLTDAHVVLGGGSEIFKRVRTDVHKT